MSVLDDLKKALGPAPSSAVGNLRLCGFVAWDMDEVPQQYRALVDPTADWVAYVTPVQFAKDTNAPVFAHLHSLGSTRVDLDSGGKLYFGKAPEGFK